MDNILVILMSVIIGPIILIGGIGIFTILKHRNFVK